MLIVPVLALRAVALPQPAAEASADTKPSGAPRATIERQRVLCPSSKDNASDEAKGDCHWNPSISMPLAKEEEDKPISGVRLNSSGCRHRSSRVE